MMFAGVVLFVQLGALFAVDDARTVVANVNGTAITSGDIEFAAMQQEIAADERLQVEPKLIERLIDRQLVRTFLASRKIEPVADDLQLQIAKAEEAIRKQGEDPKQLLAKIGYTPERLKGELGLLLAWQVYVRKTVTQKQIVDYFEKHKQELDGTQVRASQIFLKLPNPVAKADISAKKETLSKLSREIAEKKMSFAEAAKQYSEAPTRERGGDVGLFSWRGKLPATVSNAAFSLKVGEVSEPVVSPFGVHLIRVTERHPGDFSLEDVRPVIVDRLSQQMWNETVEQLRATSKIEWKKTTDAR